MTKEEIKKEKKKLLKKLSKAKDTQEKLLWQNVYFWWIRNEDSLKT